MKSFGKTVLIPGVCAACLLYLAGDLLVFCGPLRILVEHAMHPGDGGSVVAKVCGKRITLSQLDRAVNEQLWLDGKTLATLPGKEHRAVRLAVLEDLVDRELLRTKAAKAEVSAAEIDAEMRVFHSRFESPDEMKQAMKTQGIISTRDLRNRIAARIQQEKQIQSQIGPSVRVSDGEARAWYENNSKSLEIPERVEVRHVFLATLERPEAGAKSVLESALSDLSAKRKDFATLAKELSDDLASKDQGGALGWMTRSRMPADFAVPVFDLPLHQPSLIRTKLGWHLVEVTARKPAEPRRFEDAKAEITAALEAEKTSQMVAEYRRKLRQSEQGNIRIFEERIPR